MAKLVKCKSCDAEIAKTAKTCPHCGAKNKKPFYKRWWFWLIAIVLLLSMIPAGGEDTSNDNQDSTNQIQQRQTNGTTSEKTEDESSVSLTFEIIAGESGDYGEMFTLNKGTEFEDSYYIYRIPAGTYTVTNTGDYMSQLNVYSCEIYVNEDGWEEPADCYYVKILDVGNSDTVSIPEGYYIHIDEPAKFTFEQISTEAPVVTNTEKDHSPENEPEKEDNTMTTGQKNALRSAKSYLNYTAFSREVLIKQLEYEGYSTEDATFAVDNCGADWMEQALIKAKDYLDFSAFSYSSLVDQLEFEGFTTEEATYGVDNCGADWMEQAARKAKDYLDMMAFSKEDLIDQLEFEGFTHEQAVYGAEQNGY